MTQIEQLVTRDYMLDQGSKKAKVVADKEIAEGKAKAAAVVEAGKVQQTKEIAKGKVEEDKEIAAGKAKEVTEIDEGKKRAGALQEEGLKVEQVKIKQGGDEERGSLTGGKGGSRGYETLDRSSDSARLEGSPRGAPAPASSRPPTWFLGGVLVLACAGRIVAYDVTPDELTPRASIACACPAPALLALRDGRVACAARGGRVFVAALDAKAAAPAPRGPARAAALAFLADGLRAAATLDPARQLCVLDAAAEILESEPLLLKLGNDGIVYAFGCQDGYETFAIERRRPFDKRVSSTDCFHLLLGLRFK